MDDDIATFLEFLFTELEGGISTVRTAGDSDFLSREGRISPGSRSALPMLRLEGDRLPSLGRKKGAVSLGTKRLYHLSAEMVL